MANTESFLGRLKEGARGIIFEDESVGKSSSQPAVQAAVQPTTVVSPGPAVASFPGGAQLHRVNPEIKVQLDQAVAEANQVSYTEFLNYLQAMSTALAGMDEATRYRAAIAASAQKGFTPQEILRGLDAILQVIRGEEQNFNTAAAQRINERVGARESELADIERRVNDNLSKISMLQNENQQLNLRRTSVSEEIQAEKRKVEDRKNEFASTVAVEVSRYEDEKRKITSYSGRVA